MSRQPTKTRQSAMYRHSITIDTVDEEAVPSLKSLTFIDITPRRTWFILSLNTMTAKRR